MFVKAIIFLGVLSVSLGNTHSIESRNDLAFELQDLVVQEITSSYQLLQMVLKSGASQSFPGFASLYRKLSEEMSSKAESVTKILAKRRFALSQGLLKDKPIKTDIALENVRDKDGKLSMMLFNNIARESNKKSWQAAIAAHDIAGKENTRTDPQIQDFIESELLYFHVDIDKMLEEIHNRISKAPTLDDANLITFMIDEELLESNGDWRKKIFD